MESSAMLYVGADNATGKIDLGRIATIVSKRHEGFTIVPAFGYWQGSPEASAVVIISGDRAEILATADQLRSDLKQEAIGLQWSTPIGFVKH